MHVLGYLFFAQALISYLFFAQALISYLFFAQALISGGQRSRCVLANCSDSVNNASRSAALRAPEVLTSRMT
ncbi:hypothetical protein MPRF_06630 [Mycolicibacterium parafortuitum]|uniref:Uncharacterized protein n=1 Tax=Mycolicibacterium parafortuitum TaxID=39692 RepID=A0A7I7TXN7_MYCPF|nr:hypothetical protein MPRF_06630 [Mycolicibacterium parafortuitum]